jgi:hypothetical protein
VDRLGDPPTPTEAQINEITADSAQLQAVWAEVTLVSGAKVSVLATEVREALDAVFI